MTAFLNAFSALIKGAASARAERDSVLRVKHIALRHGAQISISSELGKGTKITVVFEENKGENSD